MASPKTVYLVTGGSRGIGRGLVEHYLSRSDNIVIAAVRNPSSSNFDGIRKGEGSELVVVKIDSQSDTDAFDAIKTLQAAPYNISHIDVVVANAGIVSYGLVAEATVKDMTDVFKTNVLGPLTLFQATLPLLKKSTNPKFVAISSGVASIAKQDMFPAPQVAYGSSKAMVNYVTRKIHFENEFLVAFPISPGWVQTDMGNESSNKLMGNDAPVTLQQSIEGLSNRIDNATRENSGGKFIDFVDGEWPW